MAAAAAAEKANSNLAWHSANQQTKQPPAAAAAVIHLARALCSGGPKAMVQKGWKKEGKEWSFKDPEERQQHTAADY